MTGHPSLAADLGDLVDNIVEFDRVDSTHKMAQRLIAQMDEEGLDLTPTLLVASSQSQGIGRLDRKWQNAVSGISCNWLRSGVDPALVAKLPMLAASCLCTALADLGIYDAAIKWPNDILVSGRKIAGILVHARHSDSLWVTIGLGVNLSAAPSIDRSPPATAIADHIDELPADAAHRVIVGFVEQLNAAIDDPRQALENWRGKLIHNLGDTISVRLASGNVVTGKLTKVGSDGFLCLATDDGEKAITGGDIVE